jgi:hypothetical protein
MPREPGIVDRSVQGRGVHHRATAQLAEFLPERQLRKLGFVREHYSSRQGSTSATQVADAETFSELFSDGKIRICWPYVISDRPKAYCDVDILLNIAYFCSCE